MHHSHAVKYLNKFKVVVWRHQYGIFRLKTQTSFSGGLNPPDARRLFSQAGGKKIGFYIFPRPGTGITLVKGFVQGS